MHACAMCKSNDIAPLFGIRDNPAFTLYGCKACKTRFVHPQPDDDFLRQLYSERYYEAWGYQDDAESLRTMKLATFGSRLRLIRQYKKGGAILDVGCATGFFLEAACSAGFEPFGVELSEYSAKIAGDKFGEQAIFNGVLEKSPFGRKSFDVVTMFDLLEHVRDPMSVLKKTSELLKDDGIVAIMTPDTDSLTHRLMGKKWTHYKIEHLFYFNRKSIRELAGRCGFSVVHREPARKALNLAYLYYQFQVYRHWFLTPLTRLLYTLLPGKLLRANFTISIGEMIVCLQKTQNAPS
jgi:SAM-dependent methyltransferase